MSAPLSSLVTLLEGSDSALTLSTLSSFCTTNADCHVYKDEDKPKLCAALVKKATDKESSKELLIACIDTLRLLLRDTEPITLPDDAISMLLEHAALTFDVKETDTTLEVSEPNVDWTKDPLSVPLAESALKCLVNFVTVAHSNASMIDTLIQSNGHKACLARLMSPDCPDDFIFPILRILFSVTLKPAERAILNQFGVLHHVINLIGRFLPIYQTNTEDVSVFRIISEALKLVVNCTMELGPLEGGPRQPTSTELTALTEIAPFWQILLLLPITSHNSRRLKGLTINCLINAPTACIAHFDKVKTLHSLMEFLGVQIENTENPAAALTPILLVLTGIMKAEPVVRPTVRGIVFPMDTLTVRAGSVDAPQEVAKGDTIGGKLVQYMTSVNVALKHYATEFIMQCCEEDVEQFIQYTGFGNAAGYLAMHNLLGMMGNLGSGAKATNVTTRIIDPEQEPRKPMTPEEEARLISLMERLEARGMLKVVRKGDEPEK